MIFTPNFLPSIPYFSRLIEMEEIFLNENDVYIKQTFRNRAQILGANKIENLIIPVHASSGKTPIKEVKIDNHSSWQRTQLRTIEAAYKNSAFYQFYDYLFLPIFEKKYKYLIDIQTNSLNSCFKALQISKEVNWRKPKENEEIIDYSAKQIGQIKEKPIVYRQNFGNTFSPNLAILDLIFNMGPESNEILINHYRLNTP